MPSHSRKGWRVASDDAALHDTDVEISRTPRKMVVGGEGDFSPPWLGDKKEKEEQPLRRARGSAGSFLRFFEPVVDSRIKAAGRGLIRP